jgi:polyferredoxin
MRPALARFGDAMQRHRGAIRAIQWTVVLVYALLLVVPALMPLPPAGASIVTNLTLAAQFVFWGLWWPFVILSVMLAGRVWCGVFCPEGTLSEFASRHGRGGTIPRWMRWSGWPVFAFIATTVYGQLISVYDYPRAALLILGGSTLAAVVVGYLYGQDKRVWCRYLCPVSGVFALLAKVAPVHFKADEAAWKRHTGPAPRVNCAPLLNIRQIDSASACHACGRCSGHRGAIALQARSPNAEILMPPARGTQEGSAALLVFGVLGVAVGAFQWTLSPWFVMLKQLAAEWLVAHEWFALLDDNAPWWLLTHEAAVNDVFSWLDGLLILACIGGYALVAGGLIWASLQAASRLLSLDWRALAMTLVPLAGVGLFLGLSMMTVKHLKAEGVPGLGAVVPLRALLLALGLGWSAWLAWRLLGRSGAAPSRRAMALALSAVPLVSTGAVWYEMLFVW